MSKSLLKLARERLRAEKSGSGSLISNQTTNLNLDGEGGMNIEPSATAITASHSSSPQHPPVPPCSSPASVSTPSSTSLTARRELCLQRCRAALKLLPGEFYTVTLAEAVERVQGVVSSLIDDWLCDQTVTYQHFYCPVKSTNATPTNDDTTIATSISSSCPSPFTTLSSTSSLPSSPIYLPPTFPSSTDAPSPLPDTNTLHFIPQAISIAQELAILSIIASAPRDKWHLLSSRRLQVYGGTVHSDGLEQEPLPRWLEDVIDIVAKAGITYPPYPQNDSHPEVKSSLQDKSSSSYHDTHLNRDVVESNTNTGDLHTNPSTPEQQEESEIKANARYPRANHILINEYKIGEGISAHLDGPAYSPQAVILSLSTPTSLLFWKDYPDTRKGETGAHTSIHLPPRSLVAFSDDLYKNSLHGIVPASSDTIYSTCANKHILWPHLFQPPTLLTSTCTSSTTDSVVAPSATNALLTATTPSTSNNSANASLSLKATISSDLPSTTSDSTSSPPSCTSSSTVTVNEPLLCIPRTLTRISITIRYVKPQIK